MTIVRNLKNIIEKSMTIKIRILNTWEVIDIINKGDIVLGYGAIKKARRIVSSYLREHEWDEEDIKDLSDEFILGFMCSQYETWKDIEDYRQRVKKILT